MSSTFLAVPLKSTNEVDLAKPLISYIETIYQTSNDLSSEIKEAVQELNKLRNKACNQPLDKHQSALDVLTRSSFVILLFYSQQRVIEGEMRKRDTLVIRFLVYLIIYYDQLVAIENKLPITAAQNPIAFKWKDAFDKGSLFFSKASLTLTDGSFERAAVLFNCGALMSGIAASQAMHTDEEMKTSAKLFQQSAGVFAALKDTILGLVQQVPPYL
ncbi:unnamed protein product [Toxocara canis]|uniref:BRO1 domain-containing protein n=1 Tax=Toxocara canis TaxID=6265 RepID=A0A183VDX0_TOXCA|nr:unnamed protein product [Toxocara canis]